MGGGVAQKNLHHFDHTFKAELHTSSGDFVVAVFGACSFAKRTVQVVCKGSSFEIAEEVGLTSRKALDIPYATVSALTWDHANSEVKVQIQRGE